MKREEGASLTDQRESFQRFREFLKDGDEDDDVEVVMVSSRRKRLEAFRKIMGLERDGPEDSEDDILVVSRKPTLPNRNESPPTLHGFLGAWPFQTAWSRKGWKTNSWGILLIWGLPFILVVVGRLRHRLRNRPILSKLPPALSRSAPAKENIDHDDVGNESLPLPEVTTTTPRFEGSSSSLPASTIARSQDTDLPPTPELEESSNKIINNTDSPTSNDTIRSDLAITRNFPSIASLSHEDHDGELRAVRRMARDIQLARDALVEKGLDASWAPQIAVGLRCHQQLLETQRQLHEEKLALESREKAKDRRLSRQQHAEAMVASKHDPNWRETLDVHKGRCTEATVRLLWEAFAVRCITFHLLHPLLAARANLLGHDSPPRALLQWILSQLCYLCLEPETMVDGEGDSDAMGWLGLWVDFPRMDAWLSWESPASILGLGVCYLRCGVVLVGAACGAVAAHQALRGLAAPILLHHAVNGLVVVWYCGGFGTTSTQAILGASWEMEAAGVGGIVGVLWAVIQRSYFQSLWTLNPLSRGLHPAFYDSLQHCLETLKALELWISLLRIVTLAACCAHAWTSTAA